jgi:DNA polymerase III subunit alpha
MAANLSRNLSHITEITKFMQECKRMKLNVLGPDVNESFIKFMVNKKGDIRFGLAAVKGVGEGAVQEIINARTKGGEFNDIFDFSERVNLQTVNKKNLEAMAMAGAFEGLGGINRRQFFAGEHENDSTTFIEKLIRYGTKIQSESQSMQQNLFGDFGGHGVVKKPDLPPVEEWPKLILLEKEKSLIGVYLTAHPLDDYRLEMDHFCTKGVGLKDLNEHIETLKDRELTFGGMVTEATEGISKAGTPYSKMTISDYTDSYQIFFFKQDYVEFGKYCKPGLFVLVRGRVQKRYNSEAVEYRVSHMELLSEVRRNHVKTVTLTMPLWFINKSIIDKLENLAREHKGSTLIKFNVYDPETNRSIQLFSRNTKIAMDNALINFFDEHPEIVFRIN